MTVNIRQAKPEDGVLAAPLIVDAIGEIADHLTGETDPTRILEALATLFARTDNRHSYLNTYVAEVDDNFAGIMVVYGGDQAPTLDGNLEKWLRAKGATVPVIEIEARPDEFYIDTICTDPAYRGHGVGTALLHYADEAAKQKGYSKVSLSVEQQKKRARALYERVGFVYSEPWMIIGEEFDHLVKNV
ncbi:GNAT family N-acetyltransferase [Kurthia massiliensis]|uniref:GNAT family N-acetyltransferase n=1 Tax=Kurthia massiliensis TaxID=1033739 RepID=UPI0002881DB2|nr:GNAT family N-acetyltransferase [Kurthia massiliensis]